MYEKYFKQKNKGFCFELPKEEDLKSFEEKQEFYEKIEKKSEGKFENILSGLDEKHENKDLVGSSEN